MHMYMQYLAKRMRTKSEILNRFNLVSNLLHNRFHLTVFTGHKLWNKRS
jgi:hypothetical protein